jgi:hypothetical protein
MDLSQKQQWKLLDTWFRETNPKKTFKGFLLIHNFPNDEFGPDGLSYIEICKKLWYSTQENNPIVWVNIKLSENNKFDENNIPKTFVHEAEQETTINRLQVCNSVLTQELYSYKNVLSYLMVLIPASLGYLLYNNQVHETNWWLK